MRTFLLFPLLLSFTTQLCYAQLQIRIKAGFTSTTARVDNPSSGTAIDGKAGLQAGVSGEVALSKRLAFLSAIQFTQKGFVETSGINFPLGRTVLDRRINYLELPLDVAYKPRLSKSVGLFIGAGLVPAFGVADKLLAHIYTTGSPDDNTTTHAGFGENKQYKRFVFGANGLAGVQYKTVSLMADYTFDLTSLNHSGYGQTLAYNRTLAVTLAYRFFQRKNLRQLL